MKGAIVSKPQQNAGNSTAVSFLVSFFIKPFKSGLYGFAAFFTVLIITKGISYLLGFTAEYVVNSEDVSFSLLGLIIVFLIRITESIKQRTAN